MTHCQDCGRKKASNVGTRCQSCRSKKMWRDGKGWFKPRHWLAPQQGVIN